MLAHTICIKICLLLLGFVFVSARIPIPNHNVWNDVDGDRSHPGVPWPIVLPVDRLREGRYELGASQNYTTEFPYWANHTLLARGQKFLANNFIGFEYATSLTTMLLGVDTQRVLISGGNTTEVTRASRRYLINVLNFWHWAVADLGSDELFEGLNLIHAVHAKVGHKANQKQEMYSKPLIPQPKRGENPFGLDVPAWQALERDILASPLRKLRSKPIFPPRNGGTAYPLNQFAMTMQLWTFIAHPIMDPERVLMGKPSEEDLWAYMHFWAFIGRALGIDDKYNVGLQPDLPTARVYFQQVLMDYFIPPLLDPTYEQMSVMEFQMRALGYIAGYADVSFILYRVCVDVLLIDCPNLKRVQPPLSRGFDTFLSRAAKPLSKYAMGRSSGRFFSNSLINKEAIKVLKFNIWDAKNFSAGILALNEEILRTSDVHWKPGVVNQFL